MITAIRAKIEAIVELRPHQDLDEDKGDFLGGMIEEYEK
jgi:hypothetical protein